MNWEDKNIHYTIFSLAKDIEASGKRVIHLEVGDPHVDIDVNINDEMCKKAKEGFTHYSTPYGIKEFRRAASQYLNVTLSTNVDEENVVATPGSKSGLKLFLDIISKNVRSAVLIEPTWSAYKGLLDYHKIDFERIKTRFEDRWEPTEDDLNKLENLDFQLLILLNPSNPTGLKYSVKTVDKIMDIVERKNAIVISDEVYFQTIYNGVVKYPSILKYEYEETVSLHSLSKSHAMTGYRLGWIVTKKEWIEKIARLIQYSYTNIPVFIQYAGVKALQNLDIPKRLRETYKERTMYMAKWLKRIGYIFHEPEATFYIFAEAPKHIEDVNQFIYELLVKKGVAVAPGESFGGYTRFIRFSASYGKETIALGMERLEEFMREWSI